ncbi:MAG: 4-(cytidine 5'-diphospho)-2-C-methyl-D-erythritol kinase [Clostridia bacterium]|nr:4-(cytidine 5'-diphospho)-2-C-methyl-D-erythritol kinase [Clostridia bacterium]
MKTVRQKAFAKLNLFLDITGTQDGFHMLDTVVTTVDLYDVVTLTARRDKRIVLKSSGSLYSINMISDGQSNNAYKAAKAYMDECGTCGADIVLHKNIPIGSGMGGSSADISAVLIGMERLYGAGCDLKKLADALGSDAGYMLYGGYARLKGRGERVELLNVDKKLHFFVISAKGGVNTADCYKAYDALARERSKASADGLIAGLTGKTLGGENFFNALYAPAVTLNENVGKAYEFIKSLSPTAALMTGSGSSVFGVFDTPELCRWAQAKARYEFKNTFVLQSLTRDELQDKGLFGKNLYSVEEDIR